MVPPCAFAGLDFRAENVSNLGGFDFSVQNTTRLDAGPLRSGWAGAWLCLGFRGGHVFHQD
jgi:hypothetical protein